MTKTKIEWCDYTINPVKGKCPIACPYCYARRMYDRFKWNPQIRYEDPFWQFYQLKNKKPSRVFVGSTIELFGDWIRPEWHHSIFSYCRAYPEHSFLFLTKLPQNLPTVIASIGGSLPENCWIGVTATTMITYQAARNILPDVQSRIKFISFEPLLERVIMTDTAYLTPLEDVFCDWVIIGQQTPATKKTEPKIEWVKEIVEAADKAGIKVFLKDNLENMILSNTGYDHILLDSDRMIRQELPE